MAAGAAARRWSTWKNSKIDDHLGQSVCSRRATAALPMWQFARFPGVEIPDEALDQLVALSLAS